MRVEVELHPAGTARSVELPPDARGLDLVRALGLAPDVHVLVRGDRPLPEDEPLRDGEKVRVIGVVSGG